MVSILSKVEEYVKKEYPSFTSKRIKYNILPRMYNQAILYAIRSVMKDAGISVGSEEYIIALDDNNNIRMEIGSHEDDFRPLEESERTQNALFIIKDGEGYYDKENNNLYVPESLIYKAAVYLEKNQYKQRKAREIIEEKGEGLNKAQKLYKKYLYMSEYMSKDIPLDESIGMDYLNDKIMDEKLEASAEKIIDKIKRAKAWLDGEIARHEVYSYISSESTTKKNRTGEHTGQQRYESIAIPKEDRFHNLNSKNPDDIILLTDGAEEMIEGKKTVTDYVFYYDKEDRQIMIIEPVSGKKYTRVIFLEDEELQEKDLPELATYYAAMPPDKFAALPNALRTGLTTFDTFKNNSDFFVDGIEDNVRPYIKDKVTTIQLKQLANKLNNPVK